MQEKRGVARYASTFAVDGCPSAVVYAAPVFVPVTMDIDDLTLQELYDHPDFVDIISAREFGMEQTAHDRLLLCMVVSAAEESLRELTELVRELAPFKEVFITQAGCTVSSHCGPGTLGVLFLRQPAQ